MVDLANRRFQYPFTNCTNCGPRYTIVVDIPYDRPNTTMRDFVLCPRAARNTRIRRTAAFTRSRMRARYAGRSWTELSKRLRPLLLRGEIVALKGIGGFQLMVDARNPSAVARLRHRKHREEKPFALMMPSLETVREYCHIAPAEIELLESQAAPIVLLPPGLVQTSRGMSRTALPTSESCCRIRRCIIY